MFVVIKYEWWAATAAMFREEELCDLKSFLWIIDYYNTTSLVVIIVKVIETFGLSE